MPEFTLPSGLVVETTDPLWEAEVHAISVGLESAEEFTFAKVAAVVPGLTREERAKLSRKDGHALIQEVNRIFAGRPEEQEAPFANGSSPHSTASNHRTGKRRRVSTSTASRED